MKTENTIREEALGENDVCREGKGGIQLAVSSQQVQVPVEAESSPRGFFQKSSKILVKIIITNLWLFSL